MTSRILSLAVVSLALSGLAGCQASISEPMLREALVGEAKDPEVLTQLCGRAIPQIEANGAGSRLKFADVVATRSYLGKEGKGTAKIRYDAPSGGPCEGTMAFDFRQDTVTKQQKRRSSTYTSNFELTNVKVSR